MFIEENKAAYTGEYIDGKREGFGTHRTKNGNKYVGYWKNDLKHGIAREFYIEGA